MAHTERLRPNGVPFFMLQVYEREGIPVAELYERDWKSVIYVCKKAQMGYRMAKPRKSSGFVHVQQGCKVLNWVCERGTICQ